MKIHLFLTALLLSGVATPLVHSQAANDNFASAEALSGDAGSTTGSNVGATVEANEPEHSDGSGGASVWYSWAGTSAAGTFSFSTEGSTFDSIISVYRGSSLGNLVLVAENDENPGGEDATSRVVFTAQPGTVYHIAVSGFLSEEGDIALSWATSAPPPQGQIAVYKETATNDATFQGTEDSSPPEQIAITGKSTSVTYVIYDIENGRSARIQTWTEKFSGITTKLYSVFAPPYDPENPAPPPFNIFPARLPGTFHWVSSASVGDRAVTQANEELGSLGSAYSRLSIWSQYGLATPLRIDASMTISVPASISGIYFGHAHTLASSTFREDPELGVIEVNLDHFIKEFSRTVGPTKATLDRPVTISSNSADITEDGLAHQKRTLENAVARVVAALKRTGHVEGYY